MLCVGVSIKIIEKVDSVCEERHAQYMQRMAAAEYLIHTLVCVIFFIPRQVPKEGTSVAYNGSL